MNQSYLPLLINIHDLDLNKSSDMNDSVYVIDFHDLDLTKSSNMNDQVHNVQLCMH